MKNNEEFDVYSWNKKRRLAENNLVNPNDEEEEIQNILIDVRDKNCSVGDALQQILNFINSIKQNNNA